jgi:prenylcysteine alpha-carboxyl methylesterase
MAADVNTGIAWVLEHAHLYGGDAGDVTLVGQSAGGHLAALCLLSQCAQAARAGGQGPPAAAPAAAPRWDPARIKAFVGVSGAYDLVALEDHFHGRGLYRTLYRSIMHDRSGAPALAALSPTQLARALPPPAAAALPRVLLLHGDRDASVPPRVAAEFAAALRAAGAEVAHKSYAGKTHTQPIVEDPMRGGRDELMDDVLGVVRGRACHNRQFGLLPAALIDLATAVCPF